MKQAGGAILSAIQIDRSADKTISVQLYLALRAIILSGRLSAGERLPATRTLAKEIGVSRTTVIDAVDRLIAEGMLVSRVGAGTYISETLDSQRPKKLTPKREATNPKKARLSNDISQAESSFAQRSWLPHRTGAFVTALPALDAFPLAHWSRISARHLRGGRSEVMGYGQPKGLNALRRAIASHLATLKGIICDPEQIFITSGAQHAFSIIGRLILNPGDRVWSENPGASGARNALLAEGAALVPVPVDHEGLVVAEGLARAPDFRLAFVTPSHQQPLGHVMSLGRRFELLKAAEDAQALIVEDDYDGEFYYANSPQPALSSMDANGRVLYVGTFSKTLFPSLRLGFVLAPERMVDAFDKSFQSWISGPPTATQSIVADFMDEGHFATHVRMMRRLYRARYQSLVDAASSLPDTIRLQETSSGFHTPAYLKDTVDERKLVAQAGAKGVTLVPISRYCIEPVSRKGIVFGFGSATPEEIRRGIEVVGRLPALQ